MAHLGHMYANGLGVPADNLTAVEYFTDAVQEAGHPSALFGLGYMHMSGYGVEKDLKKAFQFFAAATEQVSLVVTFICLHTAAYHFRCVTLTKLGAALRNQSFRAFHSAQEWHCHSLHFLQA